MAREAAVEKVNVLGLIQKAHGVEAKGVAHARTHAAVGNDTHTGALSIGVESVLLSDDIGVAAEIAEGNAGIDGDFGEGEIEEVRDATEGDVVALEGTTDGRFVANVKSEGVSDGGADQTIDGVGSGLRSGKLRIGESDLMCVAESCEVVR